MAYFTLISPNDIFKQGFLRDFPQTVRGIAEVVINGAVEIYVRMAKELLPTPAKSHYVFNLRDLSKCVQGMEVCVRPKPVYFNLLCSIKRMIIPRRKPRADRYGRSQSYGPKIAARCAIALDWSCAARSDSKIPLAKQAS